MAKRKSKKAKRRTKIIISWIIGILSTLFVISGVLIAFQWIQNNKVLIFIISGVLVILLSLLIGNSKRLKKTVTRRFRSKF